MTTDVLQTEQLTKRGQTNNQQQLEGDLTNDRH
jgi:hypothetical protein